ncbi:hypothetical protein BCR33DRAFT_840678, partial [Rhizoclosmatium globosum]
QFLNFPRYQSPGVWISHLHEDLPRDIENQWTKSQDSAAGEQIAAIGPGTGWRREVLDNLIDNIPDEAYGNCTLERALNEHMEEFRNNNILSTQDGSKFNVDLSSSRSKLKKFLELVTSNIKKVVNWGDNSLQLVSDYSGDIDSDFFHSKQLEDVVHRGFCDFLPKSDFKFILEKKIGYQVNRPTGEFDNNNVEIMELKDLGDLKNVQIGEVKGQNFRVYLVYNALPDNISLDNFTTLLWDKAIAPTLEELMPFSNLQRITHDAKGKQLNSMIGRQGMRFPTCPAEGSNLTGFSAAFQSKIDQNELLKSILGDYFFLGIHQGVKDLYTSEIYMGSAVPPRTLPSWRNGHPLYKRLNSAIGQSTKPSADFQAVDGGFNIMFENTVERVGTTVFANIKNWKRLFDSMGFEVEKNIALGCIHWGGITAKPKQQCTHKGIFKVIVYPGIKYLLVDHVDADYGYSSISVAEIMSNPVQTQKKATYFKDYIKKAHHKSYCLRVEIRGTPDAVKQFQQSMMRDIQRLDAKFKSHLVSCHQTKTILTYIEHRITCLNTLVHLVHAFLKVKPNTRIYLEETANYIHKEYITLVSQPPGYRAQQFDIFTMNYFFQQIQVFGGIPIEAFPIFHMLAHPELITVTEYRNQLPRKLKSYNLSKDQLTIESRKRKRGDTRPINVMNRQLHPDQVSNATLVHYRPSEQHIISTPNAITLDQQIEELVGLLVPTLIMELPSNLKRYPQHEQSMLDAVEITTLGLKRLIDPYNRYPYHVVKETGSADKINTYEKKLAKFVNFNLSEVQSYYMTKGTKLGPFAGYFGRLVNHIKSFDSAIIFGNRSAANAARETFREKLTIALRNKLEVLPSAGLTTNNVMWASLTIDTDQGKMQFLRVFHRDGLMGATYSSKSTGLVYLPSV